MVATTDGPLFRHPDELDDWHRWQRRNQPLARRLKNRIRPAAPTSRWLLTDSRPVHTLVAIESFGPTQRAALIEPLSTRADLAGVAYLLPSPDYPELPGLGPADRLHLHEIPDVPGAPPTSLTDVQQVLAVGNYLASGRLAYHWSRQLGARFVVAQHGLLAYQAPPLPEGAELLAFTQADGKWWATDRDDIAIHEVGLQLLWRAAETRLTTPLDVGSTAHDPGVFLGQLHGAELPRTDFARAALQYCCATGAAYRPHPAETDRLSRLMHAAAERRGLKIDRSGTALEQTTGPVAAVFSTGVLEAAYSGRPAWVVHPNPPSWLRGFWDRYGLSRWTPDNTTSQPTTPPPLPATAPALAVADYLFGKEPL